MKRRGKNPSKSKGIGIGIRSLIPSIMFPAGTSSTSSTAAFVSTMPRGQTAPTGNILDPAFMPKPSAVVASDYTASTTAGTESSIVSDLSSDDSDLIYIMSHHEQMILVNQTYISVQLKLQQRLYNQMQQVIGRKYTMRKILENLLRNKFPL